MFELIPLLSTINLRIPIPTPARKITLQAVTACESTTDKLPVFCKCKNKCDLCSTKRYAFVKANVKCGVICHRRVNNNKVECLNLDISHLCLQKGLQVRDKDDEGEICKKQR